MIGAGAMREVIELQKRGVGDDGFGNHTGNGPFATQVKAAARIQILRGGETVIAARLTGVQPVVITMRWQKAFETMDSSWRALNARSGDTYDIKSVEPDEAYAFVTLLAEKGSAE